MGITDKKYIDCTIENLYVKRKVDITRSFLDNER